MDPSTLTISQLRAAYGDGAVTPADAVRSLLAATDARDAELGGYLSLDGETALAAAEAADLSLPLGGVPIAIKDNINVKGQPCGCASKILTGYTAPYDATVIARLRAAGAIPLGRTNMDEFAMGSSCENSAIRPCRNAWDPERVPGGSSGGSATVVAANEAIAALGSDTGGSVRQPAGHSGCVGLKPTYGRVSRFGLVAFASSLDQIGPLTKSVEDSATLLQVLAGTDERDSTCLEAPVPDYRASLRGTAGLQGLRIGLPKEFFGDGLDPRVRGLVELAIKRMKWLGAETVEVSLPHTDYGVATYYIIATAEASSNLARFDGIRYGHRTAQPADLLDLYRRSREEGFGPEVKRRIILGTYVLSSGYYDAYYLRAQKVRTLIRNDFDKAFAHCDVIAGPVTPTPAFRIGDNAADPLALYLADLFTLPANLAGLPGISVPCGLATEGNSKLPVGLQFLAKPLGEPDLFRAAHGWEQSGPWQESLLGQ
ncbi:MAG: Asp-tRNA(Asn)/Glu-tRNA(Gln) amidotransferase subunit GatA [Akkermansiaceae bacterium]|nr:Asp-tRNA(Asn)/Glu-tRNA(Gln) amidotransferase subunit GatA [Akkermansiaceae bacterium]